MTDESRTRTRARKALALSALVAAGAYLTWRWLFTLSIDTLWLGLPLILAETIALGAVSFLVFEGWELTNRQAPEARRRLRTAVLVPTYNEPSDVLRPTVLGALQVRGAPHPEVWVLDDGDREWVREMCDVLGAHYLCRPAPRAHAKAGNLNHALEHVSADLLLVVDADHVPLPHALERTVGYFDDPEVAFVQSPQVFFNRSFQHPNDQRDPFLNEQSLFYDVICAGKDRNNATFWCGSSAVLRREALASVGGVATETVVEDAHTAMRLHARGWTSVYHREVLAVGLAPEDANAFIVQRGRWATGCYQLLRKENPLFLRGLSFKQRVHYLASLLHYLEGPQRLVAMLVPSLVLLTGTLPLVAPPELWLLLFLPTFVLVPLASRSIARGRYRLFAGERFALSRAAAYTKAMGALVTSRPIEFKVTPKGSGTENDRPTILRAPVAIGLVALAGLAYQTAAQLLDLPGKLPPFAYVVTVVWAVLAVVLSSAAVHWAAVVRHRRRAHRFPVSLDIHYTSDGRDVPRLPGRVADLNVFGLSMLAPEQVALGSRLQLTLPLETGSIVVSGTVVRAFERADGSALVGVAFDPVPSADADAIARWCFRNPFGPDTTLELPPSAVLEAAA